MPLVTIEGVDGTGKSTLVRALRELLPGAVFLREPGGTPFAERLRDALKDPAAAPTSLAEVFGFLAARADLVARSIRPALADDQLVILDRFSDSTIAYQGYGGGLDPDWLSELCAVAADGLQPDLTLWLDAPLTTLAQRRARRGDDDRLDGADETYMQRVQSGYRQIFSDPQRRIVTLDARREATAVLAEAAEALAAHGYLHLVERSALRG